jgi:hypothetical protein
VEERPVIVLLLGVDAQASWKRIAGTARQVVARSANEPERVIGLPRGQTL